MGSHLIETTGCWSTGWLGWVWGVESNKLRETWARVAGSTIFFENLTFSFRKGYVRSAYAVRIPALSFLRPLLAEFDSGMTFPPSPR